ncbi:MAG: MoxR family ATPase [Planctomycetaceae bacterium]|nr:MoxR family ATPase [Planctomycetaceae bacterium]
MTSEESAITPDRERELIAQLRSLRQKIDAELCKVIVGQKDVVRQLLVSLLSGGHCLITGAPGLAKTLLVKSIAQLFDLRFNRIQFTPDLMPADITGTEVLEEDGAGHRTMRFIRGPIFANVLLADEINRTPPKTQSALLEAMQEHQVTAAGQRYVLEEPFFVLATQNPIEMEGTYPLPEAQLDRFMFNVLIDYLPEDEEIAVVQQTTSRRAQSVQSLFEGHTIREFHQIVQRVPIAEEVVRYAVRIASASRPGQKYAPGFVNELVSWGAGLRAGQNLVLGGKALALLDGRSYVSSQDIQALAHPVLRHRILPNYRAEAQGVTVDSIIDRILESVEHPRKEAVA